MKGFVPRLVVTVLLVAFVMGQAEAWVHAHRTGLGDFLGCLADALAVLIVAGLVCWVSYMRTGHPIPGHGRRLADEPPPMPARRYVGPLETVAEIVKVGDGVWAGPSVELAEAPEGAEVATLPGLSELSDAHLELAGKSAGKEDGE